MTLEHKRRLFALLRSALDLPIDEREKFVRELKRDDEGLAAELRALLAIQIQGHLLDRPAIDIAGALVDREASDELVAGTTIGAWRIVRLLGHGGMGDVYLAERDGDGFVQTGALKLIKRGMDSREILERFRRERHILARLAHPNIAHLLDGGFASDGRSYLVMEYVDGVALETWVRDQQPNLSARVELFIALANAVAYAHRQLIVHRDLKPGNVLVDRHGAPHLLDFGIAKLMQPGDEGESTVAATRFLTRAYAAPEQLRGDAISTATDVYQLGVMLFELLSGARFHDNPAAITGRPTQRLALARVQLGDAGPTMISARQLRGDLGVIVSRATDVQPERRYTGAEAFADDLRRWREGRPILARADRASYRMWRFVGRHKLAMAAAAIVLIAIVAGTGAALWQARIARLHAARAETVNRFLENIFSSINPENARGRTITAKELLDAGALRIGKELAGQPAAQAQLRTTLGDTYLALGNYHDAEVQYRAALPLFGASQEALAVATLAGLAEVRNISGDLQGAEQELDRADARYATSRQADEATRINLLRIRASLASARGDYAHAVELSGDVWRARKIFLGADAMETLDAEGTYAVHLGELDRFDEALPLAHHVVDVRRRMFGADSPDLAIALHNLSSTQSHSGQLDAAIASTDEALAIRRRVLPANHADIARSLGYKAALLSEAGRAHEAIALREETVAILRAQAQPDLGLLAQELNNWGVNDYKLGDIGNAKKHIAEALAIWQKILPEDHSFVLTARSNLAALATNSGALKDGEAQLREVLRVREKTQYSAEGLQATRAALAENIRIQGRIDDALVLMQLAWNDVDAHYAAPNVTRAITLIQLAQIEIELGRDVDAEQHARAALVEADALVPDGNENQADANEVLARVALHRHHADDAQTFARIAIAGSIKSHGADHWRTATARGVLGTALIASGKRREGRDELGIAIKILEAKRPWMPALAQFRRAAAG